ncbi:MAG: PDGLE domain-containing protein [Dehalococcoidia bacterium]
MATTDQASTPPASRSLLRRYWWVAGLVIAVVVVSFAVPFASSDPDGLEKVAEDKEFVTDAEDNGYEWLPDYSVPGVDNERVSGILAGVIGLVVVFLLMVGFGRLVARRRSPA